MRDVNFCPERVGLESWQLLSDDLDLWIILTSHDSSQNVVQSTLYLYHMHLGGDYYP